MKDDLWNYLVSTDNLDDFLGLEVKCPNCNSKLVEIIYGRPDSILMEKVRNKEVFLGGCIVSGSTPKYHCYECNKNYTKDLDEFNEEAE